MSTQALTDTDVWCFYNKETLQASAEYWPVGRVIALATSSRLLKLQVVDSTCVWLDLKLMGRCPNGTGEVFYRVYAKALRYEQKKALYEAVKNAYRGTKHHPKVRAAVTTLGIRKLDL